jgi:hypothetical protein
MKQVATFKTWQIRSRLIGLCSAIQLLIFGLVSLPLPLLYLTRTELYSLEVVSYGACTGSDDE